MAMNVYLWLKANGSDVEGESTVSSDDRENTIECMAFEDSVFTEREASTGLCTGERTYGPIKITKRIDKSTPLLAKALVNRENIEGTFKFYRPNPSGDGTTEQFFTVQIEKARVFSIARKVPDTFLPASNSLPAIEEIGFSFQIITWTYESTGATHIDDWDQRA